MERPSKKLHYDYTMLIVVLLLVVIEAGAAVQYERIQRTGEIP